MAIAAACALASKARQMNLIQPNADDLERYLKNFVIAFQATREQTEGLALALGLGAVQGGADIRLRHLAPSGDAQLAHQGYGRLKTADLQWAECVAVGLESAEAGEALEELAKIAPAPALSKSSAQKRALVFGPKGFGADGFGADAPGQFVQFVQSVQSTLVNAGFELLDADWPAGDLSPEWMIETGRRLAETDAA